MRSKATWSYTADFLQRCEPELAVTADDLRGGNRHVVVAEVQVERVGFHAIEPQAGEVLLHSLFVDPGWMGRGIGRELFEHAAGVAARLGATRLVAIGDPNAAGFYARMGAQPDGDVASPVDAHRRLPRYVLGLC
jgi:GNAT superfamily N-acetyltransferase